VVELDDAEEGELDLLDCAVDLLEGDDDSRG
jgi:hypothetical protein